LLGLTRVYLVIQNLIAAGSITVLLGSASLIGGHGTTIAWAHQITERFGLANAMEIGAAAATLGLVIASHVRGPGGGGHRGGFRRHQPRGDTDRHRQYDGDHESAWRGPDGLIILPLVSAFFIDLANAAAIGFLVR
jgi:Na+/glutamate symporter